MEKLLPILLLLFSTQKDKTPNFTEQCKAIFSSNIFDNISLGKWRAKEIADMIDTVQSLQKENVLGNLQKGNLNLQMIAQLCKLFGIKLPKGLDFNTIFQLSSLASTLQGSLKPTKNDISNTQPVDTSLKNPLAPIVSIANADIVYILTDYFSTAS